MMKDKPMPLDAVTARGWKHNSAVLLAMVVCLEVLLIICAIIHMSHDPECSRFFLLVGALYAILLAIAAVLCIIYSWKYPRTIVFMIGAFLAIFGTITYTIYIDNYFEKEWSMLHLGKKERRSSEDFVNDIIIAAVVFCAA